MCGKIYNNEEDFINDTTTINNHNGLKQSYDDDDLPIVELYRNCSCGSTLMNFFGDRRENTSAAEKRRKKFGELLNYLVAQGLEHSVARIELLKAIRGEKSEILKGIKFPNK
ncbi:MAG: oxidoreductase [Gammaproteobacteria bacterium]|nr:oxidoreductase [Gammaproteobacteria bacterium]